MTLPHTPIQSGGRGLPAWAIGLVVVVLLAGGGYLAGNLSGENPPIAGGGGGGGGDGNVAGQARAIISRAQPSCTTCHGDNLDGQPPTFPSLHGVAKGPVSENLQDLGAEHPDNWAELWIAGTEPAVADLERGGMPAFGDQLSEEEIATIVEYLKTLGE